MPLRVQARRFAITKRQPICSKAGPPCALRSAHSRTASAARALGARAGMAGAALLLGACTEMPVLSPAGFIGSQEKSVIVLAIALMLIVVVPVIVLTLVFAWRYRASNEKAVYAPDWSHSTPIEVVAWTVPSLIVIALSVVVWNSSHKLDPAQAIESAAPAIRVEAISLNWKWLFIYPDQNIAVVNELAMPVGVPLSFRITSDTVMNSLYIPQLGGQVYAMAGMQTRLNLVADRPGTYDGMSSQFSGDGFSGMHFHAIGMSQGDFDQWLRKVRQSPAALGRAEYEKLCVPAAPLAGYPTQYFSSARPHLFEDVVHKYEAPAQPAALSALEAATALPGAHGLQH